MATKDTAIFGIVERIGEHYKKNIDNRFVRDSLTRLTLERGDRDHINTITELPDYIRIQGFDYYDLYEKILALARLVRQIHREVLPNISRASRKIGGSQEEVLRSMAFSTYGVNVAVLADLIAELYVKTVEIDKRDNSADPVHYHIPELKNLSQMLAN